MPRSRDSQQVVLAYPYASNMSSRFHHSMMSLIRRDAATSRRIRGFAANSSGANVTNARNEIVQSFLAMDDEPDWLLWIDTDMVFEDDLVERMVRAAHPVKRPILGALCFSLQKGMIAAPTTYTIRPDGKVGRLFDYPRDQLFPVDSTGTGCLLVHRSVFEKMGADRAGNAYVWFQETAIGDLPVGEDVTFCLRARALDFPVFIDSSIKVGHEKTFVVDESVFDAQQQARQYEAPTEPTFVVVASKDRRAELEHLLACVESSPGVTNTFVYDNGYRSPLDPDELPGSPSVIYADDQLHVMWNEGLAEAAAWAEAAGHEKWNVLVVNDDVDFDASLIPLLALGLRSHEDIWITYPNVHGIDIAAGQYAELQNNDLAGQTMSGWCFMLRGETGLRFDEQFEWWYGDSDLERQVRSQGKHVVTVGGAEARHLHPMESTAKNPLRLLQAREDERRFAAKWGLDADELWLAQHPEFGTAA